MKELTAYKNGQSDARRGVIINRNYYTEIYLAGYDSI